MSRAEAKIADASSTAPAQLGPADVENAQKLRWLPRGREGDRPGTPWPEKGAS